VTADRPFGDRAIAFGLPAVCVDGNDVQAVYRATCDAVQRARSGEGASFIEARTYRFSGHHVGDVGFGRGYRTPQEFEEMWQREPIARFHRELIESNVFALAELETVDQQVEAEVQEAIAFATGSPVPSLSELTEDVYA